MKIITLAMILLLFHLMIPTASTSIVINEVELDPPASELFGETQQWIELYNSGGEDVDISGMVVYPIKNPSEEMDIEDGTIIGEKGFFVISPSSWLDNKGISLILKDENGTEIDRTPFLTDIDEDDCAWTRYPDGGPEWMFMVSSQGSPASGELCEEKEVLFTRFTMDQNVNGVGFTNVLSSISALKGTSLISQEHGSGNYRSENALGYFSDIQTEGQYIKLSKEGSMEHIRTDFNVSDAQPINFTSRWTSAVRSVEDGSSAYMQESYRHATNINGTAEIVIGSEGSKMAIDSEFTGVAKIKYTSQELKSTEDYAGSFRVTENFSESHFNKTALSTAANRPIRIERQIEDILKNKSASTSGTAGYGFVRVEKQIGDKLRTYEHGTGIYLTDEKISTDTNTESIARDITLIYKPVSYNYSPQTTVNQSLKWREGFYSKDFSKEKGIISIAEDFSDISQLKKEIVANGSKSLSTQASFTGRARFRTNIQGPSGKIYQDDEYYGSYNIARKAIKLPKIEKPHFSITKQGRINSQHCDILDYSIIVFNDGNRTLGPIYVRDTFPSGTQLLNTNLMPLELTARSANWSIRELHIGESFTIQARLQVTKRTNSTINRVRAFTVYEEIRGGTTRMRRLSASNTSTMNITWDKCEPTSLQVYMSTTPDKSQPNIVIYKLNIENLAEENISINATVSLPEGIKFVNSTSKPSSINDGEISWSIDKLTSGKRRAISFIGEASGDGYFVTKAQVNGRSPDGHELASENVSVPVLIGKYIEFAKMNASEWLPCSCDPQFRSIVSSDTKTMCCDLW